MGAISELRDIYQTASASNRDHADALQTQLDKANAQRIYAIASTFTEGRFSAYPLPGRTFLLKAGATF